MNSIDAHQATINVCVIGAGVSGLTSVKACLEAGLKVTCYERSGYFGGLWHYQSSELDQKDEFRASVMSTTILNTSKELSAFSDFPPPEQLPNFMRHDLYMDYIRRYVNHFKLGPHLKLKHEVLSCKPKLNENLDKIRWSILVRDRNSGQELELEYDKLMIAVGHHNSPFKPKLAGEEKFQGQLIHSSSVKNILSDERFLKKDCLVIGIGNSACDAANDLALVANKCYLSCHRGQWFLSRLTSSGLYDFSIKNRWKNMLNRLLPTKIVDRHLVNRIEAATDHKLLGLRPKHMPSEQVPAINDLFPYRVFTGGVVLKGALLELTENGAIFEGEHESEYPVQVIIMATGYIGRIPFLDLRKLGILRPLESDQASESVHDEFDLYMNMFAPRLNFTGLSKASAQVQREAIESLVFVGYVQPSGSIAVISELQARYAAQIFLKKLKLPKIEQMNKANEVERLRRARYIRSHSRDQLVGDWIQYQDRIATLLGCKPNLEHLLVKDLQLWYRLLFGPSAAYQYRLVGPNSDWQQARRMIMELPKRVYCGINEGKNHILFGSRLKSIRADKARKE